MGYLHIPLAKHSRFIRGKTTMNHKQTIAAQQEAHSIRATIRANTNGQPNGYRPITEEELQAIKHAEFLRSARAA
jgi:hypothetical protein